MATVDLTWRDGDESLLTPQVFANDPPFVIAPTVADRFVAFEATAGDVPASSSHRELWLVDGTEGLEFVRALVGPRRSWYSTVTPQHGVGVRYTEGGGRRSTIIAWQNIAFGFWWTMNVGVWASNLDGQGFMNRQINAEITPLIHNVSVIGAGAARVGGVVTAPVAAGHRIRAGDPIVVDLANAAFDGLFEVAGVTETTVAWLQVGADDATGGTGTISHQFDFWLDLAVDPGTNIAHVRVWKDMPGETVPDWTTLDVDAGVDFPGSVGNYISQPDAAALDLTGTMTHIADVTMNDWTPVVNQSLISKFGTTNPSGQRSYRSRILNTGRVEFGWATAGLTGLTLSSTDPLPGVVNGQRMAVATTFVPNDGAGNKRLLTYLAPTHKGPWTLIEDRPSAGTTTIHVGTAPLELGAVNTGALEMFGGRMHYAALKSGDLATGTVVAEFVPQSFKAGLTSWGDTSSGQTWTLNGTVAQVNDGIPAGAIRAFSVDLDMAGSHAVRNAAGNATPSTPGGPGGLVVAHLGTDDNSRDTYGWGRFGDSVDTLAAAPPSWPPGLGGALAPRARWRRRSRR